MRAYAERARIEHFLRALGRRLRHPIRLYLVGGTVIVDLGLREATLDVDYVVQADDIRALEEFESLIPELKNGLHINAVPASPADFLPVPADVLARSTYVRSYGNVHVYYYDLPSTIISKAARGAERDLADVESLIRAGAVTWDEVETRWQEIRTSRRGWLRYTPQEIDRAWTFCVNGWPRTHRKIRQCHPIPSSLMREIPQHNRCLRRWCESAPIVGRTDV